MKRTLLILLTLVGMLPVRAQSEHSFEVAKNLDVFNSLYRQLDIFYVDTLEADKLIRIGINAMLQELDPYTVYYPEEKMSSLKMMTTGKYGGMGAYIRQRKDSTVIIQEPFADSPAAEAGLHVGDVLLKIDDKNLTGLNSTEVSELLRGEPGTTIVLRVQRPGEKKPRDFKITRRSIKKAPIPFFGLMEDAGYINLIEFTEGCAKDLRKAVIALKEKGAKSIIIDLRGNGGGLLNEAVDIVNLFVPKDLQIVEMKGKLAAVHHSYVTQNEPLDLEIPLVVLVDDDTASASEIVAGSLQDLDRAVVVGSNTYGKGLVQSSRELPYNGSLKLTTAKYYIPSGRCIQEIDYKQKRKEAEIYRETGRRVSLKDSVKSQIFHTAGGREVTESNGIKPDVEVKHDTIANVVFYISRDGIDELTDWGTKYVEKHPTIPAVKDFTITDEDYETFKKMLKDSGFKYDQLSEKRLEDLKKTAEFEGYYEEAKEEFEALEKKLTHNLDRDMDKHQKNIRKLMANEVVKRYYYEAGAVEEAIKDDEDIEKALEVLHNESEYKKILSK
ncbi:MAG: PDZ domain-containing protein [Bacteroidaceae bacterium]|nr:PDZ domain-containing protein [Bacteroidaceae bacterium]